MTAQLVGFLLLVGHAFDGPRAALGHGDRPLIGPHGAPNMG